jgi:hypothetical protein
MSCEKPNLLSSPHLQPEASVEIPMSSLNLSETPTYVKHVELHSFTDQSRMDKEYSNHDHQALYDQMYEEFVQSENVQQLALDGKQDGTYRSGVESINQSVKPAMAPSRSTVPRITRYWEDTGSYYQSNNDRTWPAYHHDPHDEYSLNKYYIDVTNVSTVSVESGSIASSIQNNYNIPYTSLRAYRQAVEESEDPKFILDFVKFLVETADKYSKTNSNSKSIKRNKILLYSEALKWIKGLVGSSSGVFKGYPEAQFLLAEWYGSGAIGTFND